MMRLRRIEAKACKAPRTKAKDNFALFPCRLQVNVPGLNALSELVLELIGEVHQLHHDERHIVPAGQYWALGMSKGVGSRAILCPPSCTTPRLVAPSQAQPRGGLVTARS